MPVTLITESSVPEVIDMSSPDLLAPLISETGEFNQYGRVLADFVHILDLSPVVKDIAESDMEELCFVVEGKDLDEDTLADYGLKRGVRTKENEKDESFVDDSDVLYFMPPEVVEALIDEDDFVGSFGIYARQLLPESTIQEKIYKATAVELADMLEGKGDAGVDEAAAKVKGGKGWWSRLRASGPKGKRLVVAMGIAARKKGAIVYKKDGWKGGHNGYASQGKKGGSGDKKGKYEKYAKSNKSKSDRNRKTYASATKGKGQVTASKAKGGLEKAKGKAKAFTGYAGASESVIDESVKPNQGAGAPPAAPVTGEHRNPFLVGQPAGDGLHESIALAGAASTFGKNRTSTKVNG